MSIFAHQVFVLFYCGQINRKYRPFAQAEATGFDPALVFLHYTFGQSNNN